MAVGWKSQTIDNTISQTHAVCLADINGDGLPNVVTGKRRWAHAHGDPGIDEPAMLVWYELSHNAKTGRPAFSRHVIDDNSGVGTQFQVIDVNGDGLLEHRGVEQEGGSTSSRSGNKGLAIGD